MRLADAPGVVEIVSIHAPVKGRHHLASACVRLGVVSIHAPVKGRPLAQTLHNRFGVFQSTPL